MTVRQYESVLEALRHQAPQSIQSFVSAGSADGRIRAAGNNRRNRLATV